MSADRDYAHSECLASGCASDLCHRRIHDLEDVLKKYGGKLDSVGHPTTTLEDLFLRIVEQSKAHPGRRYLPEAESKAVAGEDSDKVKEADSSRPTASTHVKGKGK